MMIQLNKREFECASNGMSWELRMRGIRGSAERRKAELDRLETETTVRRRK